MVLYDRQQHACCPRSLVPRAHPTPKTDWIQLVYFIQTVKKHRARVIMALAALAAIGCLALAILPTSAPKAAPMPQPSGTPASASATPSASPTATPTLTPSTAAPTENAESLVATLWSDFAKALTRSKKTSGHLTTAQLTLPKLVHTVNFSGCPPGIHNKLSDRVNVVRFCGGEIHVNSAAFLALGEGDRQLAVAGAFVYHALATTTPAQRTYSSGTMRNDAQVLGCIQASLSLAVEAFNMAKVEHVWVVYGRDLKGGDIFNSYRATYDQGVWS